MKPSLQEIREAVEALASIPYFPSDPQARLPIAAAIEQFCESQAGLRFMIREAVMHMRRWGGVPELRGIYCVGGFTTLDGQREFPITPIRPTQRAIEQRETLLIAPTPTPEEIAQHEAWSAQFQEKLKTLAARDEKRGMVYSLREKPYEAPEWLKNLC